MLKIITFTIIIMIGVFGFNSKNIVSLASFFVSHKGLNTFLCIFRIIASFIFFKIRMDFFTSYLVNQYTADYVLN